MKIYFFGVENWEKLHLEKQFKRFGISKDIFFTNDALNKHNVSEYQDAEIISIFIYSRIDKEVIDKLPNLKFIITRSASYDHIDVEYANKKGIKVSHIPDYGNNTVAEFTFALILALARKLKPMIERLSKHDFNRYGLMGIDLMGKTIGVIGTGRIGSHVVRIAHGFGMKILAYDRTKKEELIEKYGVEYVGLEELLMRSDVITVHLPYTKSTKYLINRFNIKLTKRNAILVNVSRGEVVELEAIVEALKEGRLAGGVAIDTIDTEEVELHEKELKKEEIPAIKFEKILEKSYLLNEDNVIISPHLAYYTKDASERILDTTVEEIARFINNEPLKYEIKGS